VPTPVFFGGQAGVCSSVQLPQLLSLLLNPAPSVEEMCDSCKDATAKMSAALADTTKQAQARAARRTAARAGGVAVCVARAQEG
jgi:hypothetical protein